MQFSILSPTKSWFSGKMPGYLKGNYWDTPIFHEKSHDYGRKAMSNSNSLQSQPWSFQEMQHLEETCHIYPHPDVLGSHDILGVGGRRKVNDDGFSGTWSCRWSKLPKKWSYWRKKSRTQLNPGTFGPRDIRDGWISSPTKAVEGYIKRPDFCGVWIKGQLGVPLPTYPYGKSL